MARASRAKGVAGEREVADIYTEHGFEVRGLEGSGDHLAIKPHAVARLAAAGNGVCNAHNSYVSDELQEAYDAWDAAVEGFSHTPETVTLFSEVKRQERLQLWQWLAQAESEAPAGTVPVVSFRRNRGQWYACLPLRDLLRLV